MEDINMKTEDKAIRAIEKADLGFAYSLGCNDAGHVKKIINMDAVDTMLGQHTNKYRTEIVIDSSMSITEMVSEIIEKWG